VGPPLWELELRVEAPCGPVRTVARVAAGSERVELATTVENAREDHRLRVHFPLAAADEEEVRAEGQFDVVRRPLRPREPRAPWVEPPDPTAHTLGAVALGPLTLLTKGLPEYEAGPDGLRLTLLRCVGTISQPAGLPTRPLAAGPPVPTPDGQCAGRHVFEYALRFDADRLTDAALVRAAQDYRTDFLGVAASLDAPLRIDGDVVFSALKGAEDGDGLVLRLFNPNATPEQVVVTTAARLSRLRLDEEDEQALDGTLEVRPGEIATLRLRP
jgi:alpha-mannosidase